MKFKKALELPEPFVVSVAARSGAPIGCERKIKGNKQKEEKERRNKEKGDYLYLCMVKNGKCETYFGKS